MAAYSATAECADGWAIPYTPRHLETDVSYEVNHLQQMVEKGLRRLNAACTQMRTVEQELRSFLDEYYGQVGVFFEQLEQVRQEITEYDRRIRQAATKRYVPADGLRGQTGQVLEMLRHNLPAVLADLQQDEWEAEMKDIYRRLVKLYHPDIAGKNAVYGTQVLQLINHAYEKKNLWAMRVMEHSLVEHALARQDTPQSRLERLRERFDAIVRAIARVTDRKTRLQRSDAWQLKQRMEQDRYLVEVIIHRMRQQIDDARRTLTQKRIEYKAITA